MKEKIIRAVDELWPSIWGASKYIHDHPEVGGQEVKAARYITKLLSKQGFEITENYLGLPTAFKAQLGSGPPAIYLLAEYDALPQIGHGCGHNLIAGASIGAALALASLKEEWTGQIVVLGTPAEETQGAKVEMVGKGAFRDCSVAMMFHPGQAPIINITSQALEAIEVSFFGDYGHSAGRTGIGNPLVSLVNFYQKTVEYNKRYTPELQIQGVITEGGHTPNLIPKKGTGKFYLRALTEERLIRLIKKFKDMAENIGECNNTRVAFNNFEPRYQPMMTNLNLAAAFAQSAEDVGISMDMHKYQIIGSIDMGNVSWQVPAIHPYLPLGEDKVTAHTPLFAQKAGGIEGEKVMATAAKALALTTYRLFANPRLIDHIWNEHKKNSATAIE